MKGFLIASAALALGLAAAPQALAGQGLDLRHDLSLGAPASAAKARADDLAASGGLTGPATWGLMILGLGGVGAILRSQGRHLGPRI
jgi:hypothetical protein